MTWRHLRESQNAMADNYLHQNWFSKFKAEEKQLVEACRDREKKAKLNDNT